MKRFFVVGLCVLSLVASVITLAEEEIKPMAEASPKGELPPPPPMEAVKPEVTPMPTPALLPMAPKVAEVKPEEITHPSPWAGKDSDFEGLQLALILKDAEDALTIFLNADNQGNLTYVALQNMQNSQDKVIQQFIDSLLFESKAQSLDALYGSGQLRPSLKNVLTISRKAFSGIKEAKDRIKLDYSLRNRVSLIAHFLKSAIAVVDRARSNGRITVQQQQTTKSQIADVEKTLLSVVSRLSSYYVGYVKDGFLDGPRHTEWFASAVETIEGKKLTVGKYVYGTSGSIELYHPLGNVEPISVLAKVSEVASE